MADVDPDLEAAAEALWESECAHSYVGAGLRGLPWSDANERQRTTVLVHAAAVLAALRAAGWQKEGEGRVRFRAHIEDRLHELVVEPDEARTWAELKHLLRWLDGLAPVGEMGAAQAEPEKQWQPRSCGSIGPHLLRLCEKAKGHDGLHETHGALWVTDLPVAAPMSHAVLGDETSTSGGVGIPSAAVPEQPSAAALAEALQEAWNDWCGDAGCIPDSFRIEGRATVYADFSTGVFVYRVIEALARGVSDSEAGPEQPSPTHDTCPSCGRHLIYRRGPNQFECDLCHERWSAPEPWMAESAPVGESEQQVAWWDPINEWALHLDTSVAYLKGCVPMFIRDSSAVRLWLAKEGGRHQPIDSGEAER